MALFNYSRRTAHEVYVGAVPMGGRNPIRLQSMTNTSTMDTEACVEQAKRIVDAGGEYVRLTTQGTREADNMRNINIGLRSQGYDTPLIADVHFNPKVADVAALYCEGVRINPGNYVDAARTFKKLEYSDEEYAEEIKKIRARLVPFLDICKENHTAVRIGVNHGSLSDRIMSRYGDTPAGMVESCMEFLRVCVEEKFFNVVISIKASNTVVMVKTVRLLVNRMEEEGMSFPLHLGVTEAGEGEDGRIKSAFGIGALLADGIGDTVRVSLSEAPEAEIPVAKKLVDYVTQRANHPYIPGAEADSFDYLDPSRRHTNTVGNIGGDNVPVVISTRLNGEADINPQFKPDYIYCGQRLPETLIEDIGYIVDANVWEKLQTTPVGPDRVSVRSVGMGHRPHPTTAVPNRTTPVGATLAVARPEQSRIYPAFNYRQLFQLHHCNAPIKFLFTPYMGLGEEATVCLRHHPEVVVIAQSNHPNRLGEMRGIVHQLIRDGLDNPVVFFQHYSETDLEDLQIKSAADMGALIIDGLCDGLMLYNNKGIVASKVDETAFAILQAGRVRTSKTEYISCPGCGRTLYDLQSTIARIKEATSDRKGLKIAIMGCIVNGPGEMADADYGYVGAGRGKISLYRKKECLERNIPEEQAVEKLIELINKK